MKKKLFACSAAQLALIAALISLLPAVPLSAQTTTSNMFPVVAAASSSSQLPKGFKIIASVPLQGEPVTRMYTQDEYGHTYLYIAHGPQSLTVIDVTKSAIHN